MKHEAIISQMTLEEKCYLLSGKDFWQTRSVERLGVHNMMLSDGPHGVRKQEGTGDQLGLNKSTEWARDFLARQGKKLQAYLVYVKIF